MLMTINRVPHDEYEQSPDLENQFVEAASNNIPKPYVALLYPHFNIVVSIFFCITPI